MSDLKRIVPTENWELIAKFSDGRYRILVAKEIYDKGFRFLSYPNQLKGFTVDKENICWKNGITMSINDFYTFSREIDIEIIKNRVLGVNFKNQAPTKEHKTHHVYGTYLHPFDYEKPISLSESIGGGHADLGYSKQYSIQELKQTDNWKEFLQLSDCEWVIPIIESVNQPDNLVDRIVNSICNRSEFNSG